MQRKWRAGLAALPAVIALLLGVLISRGMLLPMLAPEVNINLRGASLGLIVTIIGLLISVLIAVTHSVAQHDERVRRRATDERLRFLSNLDHELKNPLSTIQMALANLAEAPDVDTRESAVQSIDRQATRLSRLVTNLRLIFSLSKRPFKPIPVDIDKLLREIQDFAKNHPNASKRTVSFMLPQAPTPLARVDGDAELLSHVLQNLLDNALKFTRPNDVVEVRATEDGMYVVIEVSDTGPGISENEASRVWDPLYRGQSVQGIPGSGIGLALVRSIVEYHHGQATLEHGRGRGTTIRIRLPKASD